MSDITMCEGDGCPVKEQCKRFKAPKGSINQYYYSAPPFEVKDGKFECQVFWDNNPVVKLRASRLPEPWDNKKTNNTPK
jgi:hypothetical protein